MVAGLQSVDDVVLVSDEARKREHYPTRSVSVLRTLSMSSLLLLRLSPAAVAATATAGSVPLTPPFASVAPPRQKTRTTKRSSKPNNNPISPITPTSSPTTSADAPSSSVPPKKVLVPIGFGTEEMEAVILIHVLRLAGAHVTVASVEPQLQVEAAKGTKLVADTSISACSDQIFDLVALPVS